MGSPRYRVHSDSTQSWFHFANQPRTGTEHQWRRAWVDSRRLTSSGKSGFQDLPGRSPDRARHRYLCKSV
jgi:hypothetical protein